MPSRYPRRIITNEPLDDSVAGAFLNVSEYSREKRINNWNIKEDALSRFFAIKIIDSSPSPGTANTTKITIPKSVEKISFYGVASGAPGGAPVGEGGANGGRGGDVQLSGYVINAGPSTVLPGQSLNVSVGAAGSNISVTLDGPGATIFSLRGGSHSSPSVPEYASAAGGAAGTLGGRFTPGSPAPLNPSGTGGGGGGAGYGDNSPFQIGGNGGNGGGSGTGVINLTISNLVYLDTISSSPFAPLVNEQNSSIDLVFTGAAGGAGSGGGPPGANRVPGADVLWAQGGRTIGTPTTRHLGGSGGAGGGIYCNLSPSANTGARAFGGGGGGGSAGGTGGDGGAGLLIVSFQQNI